jgi:hypothetical protein
MLSSYCHSARHPYFLTRGWLTLVFAYPRLVVAQSEGLVKKPSDDEQQARVIDTVIRVSCDPGSRISCEENTVICGAILS